MRSSYVIGTIENNRLDRFRIDLISGDLSEPARATYFLSKLPLYYDKDKEYCNPDYTFGHKKINVPTKVLNATEIRSYLFFTAKEAL